MNSARASLNSLRKTSQSLKEKLASQAPSTGNTPRKRKWEYPRTWETIGHTHGVDVEIDPTPGDPHPSVQGCINGPEIVNLGTIELGLEQPQPELINEVASELLQLPPLPYYKKNGSKLPGPKDRPPLNVVHNGIPSRLR
jgi:hypothetical protein